MRVLFGIDHVSARPGLLAGRVGLLTNDAARLAEDPWLRSREALLRAGLNVVRLFSPEHGLSADAVDGERIADRIDDLTGLPVVSLYGDRQSPRLEHLVDLDAVAADLPDIGARFFTYAWSLTHVMEACSQAGKPVVVLDRPNPLGADLGLSEGPILHVDSCGSFLGRLPIPIRHSLTIGELARYWNRSVSMPGALEVIPCSGWRRECQWPETSLPFVPPSPAIISFESALLYPGLCLFEATNLSVGRGTEVPFQWIGSPWLRAAAVLERLAAFTLPGIVAETARLTPSSNRWAGHHCEGVRLRVRSPRRVRPVAAGLALLLAVMEIHPAEFQWATYPTAANPGGEGHLERLLGRRNLAQELAKDPVRSTEHIAAWTAVPGWREDVGPVLLYD